MTVLEKVELIEQVWESLRVDDARSISPLWHKKVLEERKELYQSGKAAMVSWSVAKQRIRRRVHDGKAA